MTISYNRLGSNGRLGNQMFQYASLRGIAAYNGYHWQIPSDDVFVTLEVLRNPTITLTKRCSTPRMVLILMRISKRRNTSDTSPIRSVKISPSDQIFSILVKILLVAWIGLLFSCIFANLTTSEGRSTIPSSRYDIFRIRSHTSQ